MTRPIRTSLIRAGLLAALLGWAGAGLALAQSAGDGSSAPHAGSATESPAKPPKSRPAKRIPQTGKSDGSSPSRQLSNSRGVIPPPGSPDGNRQVQPK